MRYFLFDEANKTVHIATTTQMVDGHAPPHLKLIGHIDTNLDPTGPYTRFVVGSALKRAGHEHISGLTIKAYEP